ncbi:hypothetical protein Pelo_19724 [Pelomyxa schiedti]|nr:hypothetical protein Pelo_19724 [Pelomyxa schiedti]
MNWNNESGLVAPGRFELFCAYSKICDINLLEYLTDEVHVPLPEVKEKELLKAIITNKKDSVPVVELMVHKIGEAKLPHSLMDSLIDDALSVSNFAVADWLEQRYHMLKTTLRRPHLAHVAKNCFGSHPLNWLLQRVPHNLLDDVYFHKVHELGLAREALKSWRTLAG